MRRGEETGRDDERERERHGWEETTYCRREGEGKREEREREEGDGKERWERKRKIVKTVKEVKSENERNNGDCSSLFSGLFLPADRM